VSTSAWIRQGRGIRLRARSARSLLELPTKLGAGLGWCRTVLHRPV